MISRCIESGDLGGVAMWRQLVMSPDCACLGMDVTCGRWACLGGSRRDLVRQCPTLCDR